MSDLRKMLEESAEEAKPRSTKRIAPSKKGVTATKADRVTRRRARDAKYGKPTSIRLSQATRQSLDQAAKHYDVGKHRLAEFLLQAGLHLLARGKIELPVKEDTSRMIELPGPPAGFPPIKRDD